MKVLLKFIFLTSVLVSTVHANVVCPKNAPFFCMTPDMALGPEIKLADFYRIPAVIISLYGNEITLDAQWESPYLGMGMKDSGSMLILGGTTRAKGMTKDAYAAAICHEIGHVLGGAPYQTISGSEWASAEGQADFFAANVCLPSYFRNSGVPEEKLLSKVEKAGYEMLSSLAPYSTETSQELSSLHRFHTLDEKVGVTLVNNYPSLKCRYETFRNSLKRSNCWFKE